MEKDGLNIALIIWFYTLYVELYFYASCLRILNITYVKFMYFNIDEFYPKFIMAILMYYISDVYVQRKNV